MSKSKKPIPKLKKEKPMPGDLKKMAGMPMKKGYK